MTKYNLHDVLNGVFTDFEINSVLSELTEKERKTLHNEMTGEKVAYKLTNTPTPPPFERVYNCLCELIKADSQPAEATQQPATFEAPKKKDLETLFYRLQNGGFVDTDTDLNTFLYAFGVVPPNGEFCPVNWAGSIVSLGWFVQTLFEATRAKWKRAAGLFLINGKRTTARRLCDTVNKIERGERAKSANLRRLEECLK